MSDSSIAKQNIEVDYYLKIYEDTKKGREYLSKTHLEYKPDDPFYKDLYSEEKIEEDKVKEKKPRIGEKYQISLL